MPPPAVDAPLLPYPAMRLRWCALALLDFLRRWAVYAVVGAAVASAGAVGWHVIISAVAAWFVMPLFLAAARGWLLLPAVLLQALFGTACIWAARNLLWPQRWAEAERSLPIDPRLQRRSDAVVVLLAQLPLLALYAVGAATLLLRRLDWLLPVRGRALLALLLAAAGGMALGVMLLQRLRRASLPRRGASITRSRAARPAAALGWLRTLLVLPLWRGPARRTGFALAAGALAMLLPALAVSMLHGGEGWFLAAAALLALTVATRVHALAGIEYAALLQAARMLPLAQGSLQRARSALGLLAVLPGLLALVLLVQAQQAASLRPAVLWTWWTACVVACAVQVLSAPAEPSTQAGRWLFSLVLCVCLATEVMA